MYDHDYEVEDSYDRFTNMLDLYSEMFRKRRHNDNRRPGIYPLGGYHRKELSNIDLQRINQMTTAIAANSLRIKVLAEDINEPSFTMRLKRMNDLAFLTRVDTTIKNVADALVRLKYNVGGDRSIFERSAGSSY